MQNQKYTNAKLALEYLDIRTTESELSEVNYGKQLSLALARKDKILTLDENIQEHYAQHGNLSALQHKGLGRTTIKILELILTKGEKEAKAIYVAERHKTLTENIQNMWKNASANSNSSGETFTTPVSDKDLDDYCNRAIKFG